VHARLKRSSSISRNETNLLAQALPDEGGEGVGVGFRDVAQHHLGGVDLAACAAATGQQLNPKP
jgi:hypothetical protein